MYRRLYSDALQVLGDKCRTLLGVVTVAYISENC